MEVLTRLKRVHGEQKGKLMFYAMIKNGTLKEEKEMADKNG